jgi:hypothetical protein
MKALGQKSKLRYITHNPTSLLFKNISRYFVKKRK